VTTTLLHRAAKFGATPSGRRAGEMPSMSLQPSPAGPRGCITEIIRSFCAIDFRDFAGGVSNVQECDPSHFEGAAGVDRLAALLRAFLTMGGMELSLNFLSAETLRAAQAEPLRFGDLMVRLFGLSARFVALSPEVQETVIARVAAARRR